MQTPILIQMDAQGRLVLPKELRGKESKYFSCFPEADGTVHLMPVIGVLTTQQAYFWTKKWQSGETEASRDIKSGKLKKVHPKKLKSYLDHL
ncbi:MAG: hypothetical protein ACD_73C00226G0005 [uncultured bacterium]|nr:MAG: hypothetical protein ACD_73C00226G0005 [uncultured bacterium]